MTQTAYKASEAVFQAEERELSSPAVSAYSVLMSVYAGEQPEYLSRSLDSLLSQTLPPFEIVLVKDGPLTPELEEVIAGKESLFPGVIHPVQLSANQGLGSALREGLLHCQSEYVARMDSDDISYPDRMEKQMKYLADHPDVDILSGVIDEFDTDESHVTGSRVLPLENDDIWAFARTRSPFNHAAVTYKKSKVLAAGSYRGDLPRVEDHDLWMRMYRANAKAANLKDHLLFVRCGGGMHTRRHGLKNALALRRFYREMYMMGEIGYTHYLFDIACACGLQLMPAWLHKACYKLIRKNTTPYQAGPKARERKPALPRGERLTRESSPEEIRLAQQEIFGIYQDVKRVCDEEGLRLILSGGSCLGAVRHGGFIPWDDDMDTVMPREDYERLKELFDSRLGDRYIMQVPGKKGSVPSNLFMKIVKKDGIRRPQVLQASSLDAKGLWLDIVPMEYAPKESWKRLLKGIACDALAYAAVSNYLYTFKNPVYRAYMSGSFRRSAEYWLRNALGFVLSFRKYTDWYDLFDRFSQGTEKTGTVTFPAGIRHYLGETVSLSTVLPPFEGEFEKQKASLPAQAHVYLKNLYGSDYLTLPPEDKRRGHAFLKPEYEDRAK